MWYKYKFLFYICVFFLKKKQGTHYHCLGVSWSSLLRKQSPQNQPSDDTENSQEDHNIENHDQIADRSLQGEGGYLCQDRNSGVETDKEAAPHKSIGV